MSDEEFRWLTYRATGGFGLVMTCAAHVQRIGNGFPGQLGVFSRRPPARPDAARRHDPRRRVGEPVQLHHAGIRSPEALIGEMPVGPSEDAETGARALSTAEVEQLAEDFIEAAVRSERAGFDGVELHGAHGYIPCAFLSPNQPAHRPLRRLGRQRAAAVRHHRRSPRLRTRPDFQLGVRISPERFGLVFAELALAERLLTPGDLDYLDMSLWDLFKPPVDEAYASRPLIDWFTELPRAQRGLGRRASRDVALMRRLTDAGADFAILGRAAILHHDYPQLFAADPGLHADPDPGDPRAHLAAERLSPGFIEPMNNWKGFVAADEAAEAAAQSGLEIALNRAARPCARLLR